MIDIEFIRIFGGVALEPLSEKGQAYCAWLHGRDDVFTSLHPCMRGFSDQAVGVELRSMGVLIDSMHHFGLLIGT